MPNIHLQLTPEMMDRIKRHQEATGAPAVVIIRKAIDEYLPSESESYTDWIRERLERDARRRA